ncbi:hypothetical protein M3Y99_01481600 [Aphelenchoides fujianensis]|nr:hypothetical protein M3Y99_01481600 [Aphelenchoides fujianensis]
MRTTTVVVLLLSSVLLGSGVPLFPKGFTISGVIQKRNAAQLAEYHRQQQASPFLSSKNFLLNYPDETLRATVEILDASENVVKKNVSLETATNWLYFFNTSMVNQTGLTPLNQTFNGKYENYDVSGYRYSAQIDYEPVVGREMTLTQTFAIVGAFLDVTNKSIVDFDGVLGLGWGAQDTSNCEPSTDDYVSPIRNIMKQQTEAKHFYVLHVNSADRASDDHTFNITFGFADYRCGTNYGYTPVVYAAAGDNGFLSLSMDGFSYGDEGIAPGGDQATVDAGAPFLWSYCVWFDVGKEKIAFADKTDV